MPEDLRDLIAEANAVLSKHTTLLTLADDTVNRIPAKRVETSKSLASAKITAGTVER